MSIQSFTTLNKGFWGEYKIFSLLENLAESHQLLTNLYIPRKDGTTTELTCSLSTKRDCLSLNLKTILVGYTEMKSINIGYKYLKKIPLFQSYLAKFRSY